MKCPICDGKLISKKVPYSFKGIDFGIFDAYVCNKCNEQFMREKHLQSIEDFAKEMRVWGAESIVPYIATSASDKKNTIFVDISQVINKPVKIPFITTFVS